MTVDKKFLCGKVELSHQLIGKKWTCLIIHSLMDGPKRFSEIQLFIPDLSKKMLNERMKELEDFQIIVRNVTADRPIKIEYSLTRKGSELGQALKMVENWASHWL
jgi:DNA-binding HxlR family transcriptional regulator